MNNNGNALVKLSKATQMLAEAKSLDEVKKVLDISEAARVYARAAIQKHGNTWFKYALRKQQGFRIIDAYNNGYVTESVVVPRDILLNSIHGTRAVNWTYP